MNHREVDKEELFERMPVGKALFTMAVPTIISQLINLIYNLADTFFIGRTGNSYMMAGVTVPFPLFMMTIAFSNLFGIGGGSEMARLIGQHRGERARKVSAFAFFGCLILAACYSVINLVFTDPLLTLLGASDQTIGFARQYVRWVVIAGSIPTIASMVAAHLLRNIGYSRQAGFGLSAGGILNIILDPLFMFVLLPDGMEVYGAALATMLSNVCTAIYFLVIIFRLQKTAPISLRLSDARDILPEERKALFSVGIPSAFLTGLFDVANAFLNAIMSGHGDLMLAAIGIVMKVVRLPNAINIGICQGMLPIVAYNFSSGDHDRMNETIRTSRKAGLLICLICMVFYELTANFLAGLFLSTGTSGAGEAAKTISYAALFLRIQCLASPFQFMNYSTSFCMQAIGDGRDTMIHVVIRQIILYIPLMFLLDRLFGAYGLVSSVIFSEAVASAAALFLLNRYLKAHRAV